MSKNYYNEILNDCSWFAEKHRGKNKLSGAHWSTIIRFTPLFDEATRLQQRVDTLEAYIADYCAPTISDKYNEIERLNELSKDGAKRCPFCGEFPDIWDYEGNKVVECKNESCPMYYEYNGSIFLDVWNTRS